MSFLKRKHREWIERLFGQLAEGFIRPEGLGVVGLGLGLGLSVGSSAVITAGREGRGLYWGVRRVVGLGLVMVFFILIWG